MEEKGKSGRDGREKKEERGEERARNKRKSLQRIRKGEPARVGRHEGKWQR